MSDDHIDGFASLASLRAILSVVNSENRSWEHRKTCLHILQMTLFLDLLKKWQMSFAVVVLSEGVALGSLTRLWLSPPYAVEFALQPWLLCCGSESSLLPDTASRSNCSSSWRVRVLVCTQVWDRRTGALSGLLVSVGGSTIEGAAWWLQGAMRKQRNCRASAQKGLIWSDV